METKQTVQKTTNGLTNQKRWPCNWIITTTHSNTLPSCNTWPVWSEQLTYCIPIGVLKSSELLFAEESRGDVYITATLTKDGHIVYKDTKKHTFPSTGESVRAWECEGVREWECDPVKPSLYYDTINLTQMMSPLCCQRNLLCNNYCRSVRPDTDVQPAQEIKWRDKVSSINLFLTLCKCDCTVLHLASATSRWAHQA